MKTALRKKIQAVLAGAVVVGATAGLGYLVATGRPLHHGLIFAAVIAGLVLSDGSFWPNRPR
jgi:hypothetical protein